MKTIKIFGALIASTALAACGGGGEEPAEDAATPGSDSTQVSAPAEDTTSSTMETPAEPEAPAEEAAPAEDTPADAAPAEEAPAEEPAEQEPAAPASGGDDMLIAGLTGDAAAGRRVFARCQTCHVLQEGVNRVGPSLYGIFGRTAGTVEGFRYSEANQNSGIVWDEEIMFEYLENPRAYMPGTIMAFPGLRNEQDRANVIAYMRENGGAG